MSDVFYRSPGSQYPRAIRGSGIYLYDEQDRRYLDGSGGAAISCLGHSHPKVLGAIKQQLDSLAFAHTAFFTNEPQERLASRLAERWPGPGARSYFLAGGSEANETAIKLARQYWYARGQTDRHVIVSRRQSYHGNTLGALSASGNFKRRVPYEPLLQPWPKVSPCYAYRDQRDRESDGEYVARLAAELDQSLTDVGSDRVAAFMAETVVGASLGVVPPVAGYFKAIREVCDRHGILLILDEVMAGCGRTGSFFAFEKDGVVPDITTLAKGLGGGYQALAATIVCPEIHDTLEAGGFLHGHSFVGHATACAAGLAVLETIDEEDLLTKIEARGLLLRDELRDRFRHHPNVGDVRGRGLFCGVELVRDRARKTPIPASWGLPKQIHRAAMDCGLVCYPGGSGADGTHGAHILLAPPFIISESEIGELCTRLERTLGKVNLNDR